MTWGFGKDFYRKGNSVKRSGRFSEPLDSEKWTLISLASLYRWAVESWDVSTAFLYAPLIEKRDVYCKPPQVLVKLGLVQPGTVWKLKKAFYGLRTSPRAWEEERDRKLSSLTWDSQLGKVGLKPVDTTHCVWTIRKVAVLIPFPKINSYLFREEGCL